ncbi:hypothetical protein BDZ89DRAFT_1087714 [Hymenopellis radicata]|nr:hypothetical protein BDZ89DRAFT_1087714 [Hymenopellis radicata]
MPGKHVRFADQHAGYTVSGTTPSPSRSISSLPSSTGPITPPAFAIALPHPPAHSGHKHSHKSRPTIHPLLAVAKPRAVNFDPAISPPLSRMTITSPHLPWPIHVEPRLNGAYITVSDVLAAIYHSLRQNIRPAEFHSLPGKGDMQRVTAAYQARYRRISNRTSYEDEKKAGVKRVDFLKGRTIFAGLSTGSSAHSWIMNVS